MKLRTRLALLCGAVVCLTILLSIGLIFQMSRQVVLDQAQNSAYAESQSVFRGSENYCRSLYGGVSRSAAAYYLKSQGDDYSILLQDGEVFYNQTVLNPASLSRTEQQAVLLEGRRLLVFTFSTEFSFELIHIVDITDAYLALNALALRVAGIGLAVVALAFLAVFVILRRSLRPLQALSAGAESIAAGAYGQRVPETGRDEIAELGRDFNKMAQAVEAHIQEVEDSEEKKTLFMGSLTHELKTPLTAISGYAQTLRAVKLSQEDREAALEYIYQESKRLDRLSKKMLRLLELDQSELDRDTVAVEELFRSAAGTCAPAAEKKSVRIEMGGCQGTVTGDRDLLDEAVINLIDNAVKASCPGDVVRLYTQDGAMVVEDQGVGIPREEIARLTEPFYMVDKSRSRQSGGAGLGLALVAAVLRRHGMKLEIESEVGKGTRVRISPTCQ